MAGRRTPAYIVGQALLLVLCARQVVRAQADFEPTNEAWNGYSAFARLAREEARAQVVTGALDLGSLGEADAIVLVGPREEPPIAELARFVNAGGKLAVLDDFGATTTLLSRFGIARETAPSEGVARVRGHQGLLVVRALYRHPLTEGVDAVITNRPALVRHAQLEPLLGFDRASAGVLLTGVVGEGRLVVLSDPSVFVDLMLPLEGNTRLAKNLLSVLESPEGRIYVVPPSARLVGLFDPAANAPFIERATSLLARAATLELPSDALRVSAATVLALLALFGFAATSHRDPYRFGFEIARAGAGSSSSRVDAALALHDELTHALARRLHTSPDLLIEALPQMLSKEGIAPATSRGWTELLRDLRHIYVDVELGRRARVSSSTLARQATQAQAIFEWLGREA